MIRHYNIAHASCLKTVKLMVQDTQENAFRVILFEQTTSVVTRERDKVHVLLIVGNAALIRRTEAVT